MPEIYLDPESDIVREQYALIYTPSRRRKRFPDNCVQLCADETEARAKSDPQSSLHAARVLGPSRSSEGFMLYYLAEWLD